MLASWVYMYLYVAFLMTMKLKILMITMLTMIIIMTRASPRGRHICRRIPSRKCCRHFWSQVAFLKYFFFKRVNNWTCESKYPLLFYIFQLTPKFLSSVHLNNIMLSSPQTPVLRQQGVCWSSVEGAAMFSTFTFLNYHFHLIISSFAFLAGFG